jgi:hypothetical protein
MKTRTIGFTFAAAMLGLTGFTSLAIQACSSSNDAGITPGTGDDASTSSDTSTGNHDTGTGTKDTGTTHEDTGTGPGDDAATPDDGSIGPGTDASDLPDGGVPVTPGQVECGGQTCNLQTNTCCALPDGGGTCPTGTTCPSGTATIRCAEKADCTGTDVCCGTLNIGAGAADTKCGQGPCSQVQFCRTNSECTGGKGCVVQVCQGVTLELCGLFPTCTAK